MEATAIRFAPEGKSWIQSYADFCGKTFSDVVREAVLEKVEDATDLEAYTEALEAVDEKMAGPDPLRSFVDPANENVRAVQFVYVIEGIEPQSDTAPVQAEEDPQGLFERLMALFALP